MEYREQREGRSKTRGSDVYWEKKRDSLRRMFSRSRKPSRHDSVGRLISARSQPNLSTMSYRVAPSRPATVVLSTSMFGKHLQDSVDRDSGVANFVLWCVEEIEFTGERLNTDAIYRASGNQERVQFIVNTSEKYMKEVLRAEENVNVLTGSLKLFFRRLKMPIVDYHSFNQAFHTDSPNEDLSLLIRGLPPVHRNTLSFLMLHLRKVLDQQHVNKMGILSLSVVFGPTLMRLTPDSVDMAADMKQQNRIIEHLLVNYHAIFPQQPGIDVRDVTSNADSISSDDSDKKKRTKRHTSDSDSDDSETGRDASSTVVVDVEHRRQSESSESENERRRIAALNVKLRAHRVSKSSDVSRPSSQMRNSKASSKNRPSTIRYSSNSSESDASDSKKRPQTPVRPLSVPVRPAPPVQAAQRKSIRNSASSWKPGDNASNSQIQSDDPVKNNRPASIALRPTTVPPMPPVVAGHKSPVGQRSSSSDSDERRYVKRNTATIRIGRPVSIPVPPTAPAAAVPSSTRPSIQAGSRKPSRRNSSSSESDKGNNKQKNITGSRPTAVLPSTPAPILVTRKSFARDDSSESIKTKQKELNKSTAIGTNPVVSSVVTPVVPSMAASVLLVRKSHAGSDTSSSEDKIKTGQGSKATVASSSRPAAHPVPPPLPSTPVPELTDSKNRKHGNDTSSSESDGSKSKKRNNTNASSIRPAPIPVPPALPTTAPPKLGVHKSITRDDTSSSESDESKTKQQNKTATTKKNRTSSNSVPPELPTTAAPKVHKSVSREGQSSSESDKNDSKRQTKAPTDILRLIAGETNVSRNKTYDVKSNNKIDIDGKRSKNLEYKIKSEPIYSNQEEIDGSRQLYHHNMRKYEDASITSGQTSAESIYDIDTYRNRQIKRLTAEFDLPSDMDAASAFSRQLSEQSFLTSSSASSQRVTNAATTRHMHDISTSSSQGHGSTEVAEYATVHKQKIKQTTYKQQSKVMNVTQLSLERHSDSDSSSLSDSDDSQRIINTNRSIRNIPTQI